MHAIITPGGVCVKLYFGNREISIAFERRDLETPTREIGEFYSRADIQVYDEDGIIIQRDDVLTTEADLFLEMQLGEIRSKTKL